MGARRGTTVDVVLRLVMSALEEAGPAQGEVAELATVEGKSTEPGLVEAARKLGVPLVAHPAARLAEVAVPHPSAAPLDATGTPSVAEAAALADGGELLVPKRKSDDTPATATCAVARRATAPDGRRAEEAAGSGATAHPATRSRPRTAMPSPGSAPHSSAVPGPTTRTGTTTAPGAPAHPRAASAPGIAVDSGTATAPASPPLSGTPSAPDGAAPANGADSAVVDPPGVSGGALSGIGTLHFPAVATPPGPHDLRHHGDAEVRDAGLIDLAVNVRTGTPPPWLRDRIAGSLGSLAAYPDGRRARSAVARRHGLPPERVLLTAGAAEAFVLLARALRPRRAVVVHPQFTEPEAALRDAGHRVERLLLDPADGFRLDPGAVPEDADLVVVGNPTNPTSVLHPAGTLAALARPGRTLVVDEAFMDAVPGEREALAGRQDLPGLVVLRSLTKTWGLAGLRIGYVLAEPVLLAELERAQPLWPVSSPALAAAEACVEPHALREAERAARRIAADRTRLLAGLEESAGVQVVAPAEAPFVLIRLARADRVRERLRAGGFAVRRGDTFPGLGPDWLRLAVRDPGTTERFLGALREALTRR
nr:Rv2231c family pyridoxal phosphate-dependent protein CobC [Streptomyces triticagri]